MKGQRSTGDGPPPCIIHFDGLDVMKEFLYLAGVAKAYAARGAYDGFTGMMALHPAQVPIINAAFTPSAEQIQHARAVIDAFAQSPDAGVLLLDGRMIDAPHLLQARKLLARAGLD